MRRNTVQAFHINVLSCLVVLLEGKALESGEEWEPDPKKEFDKDDPWD